MARDFVRAIVTPGHYPAVDEFVPCVNHEIYRKICLCGSPGYRGTVGSAVPLLRVAELAEVGVDRQAVAELECCGWNREDGVDGALFDGCRQRRPRSTPHAR